MYIIQNMSYVPINSAIPNTLKITAAFNKENITENIIRMIFIISTSKKDSPKAVPFIIILRASPSCDIRSERHRYLQGAQGEDSSS